MRSRIQAVVLPSEVGDYADEVRRVFTELGRTLGSDSLAGECAPPLDVFESDQAVEIAVDLPGVDAAAVRLLMKGDTLLVIGEKTSRRARTESSFHLVERGFGRFARAVRIGRACDATRAAASIEAGVLRISIPKIDERRGRSLAIPITERQADTQ